MFLPIPYQPLEKCTCSTALVQAPKYKGFGTGGEDNVDDKGLFINDVIVFGG